MATQHSWNENIKKKKIYLKNNNYKVKRKGTRYIVCVYPCCIALIIIIKVKRKGTRYIVSVYPYCIALIIIIKVKRKGTRYIVSVYPYCIALIIIIKVKRKGTRYSLYIAILYCFNNNYMNTILNGKGSSIRMWSTWVQSCFISF